MQIRRPAAHLNHGLLRSGGRRFGLLASCSPPPAKPYRYPRLARWKGLMTTLDYNKMSLEQIHDDLLETVNDIYYNAAQNDLESVISDFEKIDGINGGNAQ